MLGWMILFALMTALGAVLSFDDASPVSFMVVLTFGVLFLLGLFTRLIRGRAW